MARQYHPQSHALVALLGLQQLKITEESGDEMGVFGFLAAAAIFVAAQKIVPTWVAVVIVVAGCLFT